MNMSYCGVEGGLKGQKDDHTIRSVEVLPFFFYFKIKSCQVFDQYFDPC